MGILYYYYANRVSRRALYSLLSPVMLRSRRGEPPARLMPKMVARMHQQYFTALPREHHVLE